jgi:NADH:ubiquinone oxidoreductase subunit F (NADH-binding)
MVEYLEHLFEFTSLESCGKCFPCRIGSTRGKEMIQGRACTAGRSIARCSTTFSRPWRSAACARSVVDFRWV